MQACTLDTLRKVMDGQLVVVVKRQLHLTVLRHGMVVVLILMAQVLVPDLVVLMEELLETVV